MASQSEIYRLCAEIRKRWPHGDMPGVDQYHATLSPFPRHQLVAIVDALDREGAKFAPRPTEIVDRLARATADAPEWFQLLADVRDRKATGGRLVALQGRTCPVNQCDGSGISELDAEGNVTFSADTGIKPAGARQCQCREQMLTETVPQRSANQVADMFLSRCDQAKLALVLDGDQTAYAQMAKEYSAYVNNLHGRMRLVGIETAGLREFERLAAERSGELVRGGFTKQITEGEAA